MGFLGTVLGVLGFGIGSLIGLVVGFYLFIYSEPKKVKDPVIRPLHELEKSNLEDILTEIPLWIKCPDYDRVDWLNKFLLDMWPYLDKLVDLQVFAAPRITLKPLVPTFPCFANIVVSLLEKQHVDFGMNILGGDIMSIPGLYPFIQDTIKRQVANLYLWPQTLDTSILDASTAAIKKPVGILQVKVVRALKLLRMDFLGTSDPYVKLSLTEDRLADMTDWECSLFLYNLQVLTPGETKEFVLDLVKNTNLNDPQNKKRRGQLVVELTYVPLKSDSLTSNGPDGGYGRTESGISKSSDSGETLDEVGLLSVMVVGAEEVEGEHHNNPYALLCFKGEEKKTKVIKKSRNPSWNEDFQFMPDEPPLNEKIHIEVLSRSRALSFRRKESLGYVEINLSDVVHNGRINQKYHLIDSKNGKLHVELSWTKA
ncbi:hypothetical protein ACLB2K_071754 [Fragaria x ananassa]